MKHSLIVLLLSAVLLNTSCQHHEEEKTEITKCTVTNPIIKDTLVYKEYVGQIQSIQHIELRALEKGYIQHIYVKEGQYVRKGELLFQIMPNIYQTESQKAAAEVNFAKIEYQNTKRLADSNIVSKNELALAKAKLDKAKAELAMAQTHLSFTQIKAPFDGIIDRFHVRLGSLVDEGELLTTLADNSKMWVYYNVPEAEYLDYATSKKKDGILKVKLQMANKELFDQQGVVETIEADFDNETGNIPFRATFTNPKQILRHGETGNILMPIALKKAMLIPQKATFETLDKKYVYVVDKDNKVEARLITVGTELQHLFVVTDGLQPTDKILVDGLRKVKNGDKINYDLASQEKVLAELNHLHAE